MLLPKFVGQKQFCLVLYNPKHMKYLFSFIPFIVISTLAVAQSNCLLDSVIYYIWKENTGEWIPSENDVFLYTPNDSIASIQIKEWNTSTWENHYLLSYSYDTNNNLEVEQGQTWGGTNWLDDYRNLFTYSSNNRMSLTNEFWNGNNWENAENWLYGYGGNDNTTSMLYQFWDESYWLDYQADSMTYNIDNLIITQNIWFWDEDNLLWLLSGRDTMIYDLNNNLISQTTQTWENNAWSNAQKYEYSYDINNNRTAELHQLWNNNAWENYSQNLFSYDGNNLITETQQNWSTTAWNNNRKITHTYTSDFLTSDLYQSWNGTQWLNTDSVYYYCDLTSSINQTLKSSIDVFPNPASDMVTIESTGSINSYQIYDVSGKVVLSGLAMAAKFVIDISRLNSGVYYISVSDKERMTRSKLIKQ